MLTEVLGQLPMALAIFLGSSMNVWYLRIRSVTIVVIPPILIAPLLVIKCGIALL